MLDRHQAFDGPTPRVEPFLAGTVRRYVEQNLGIAVVYGPRPAGRKSAVHERLMSRYFGRGLVRFVFRNGAAHEDAARVLAAQVRTQHAAGH